MPGVGSRIEHWTKVERRWWIDRLVKQREFEDSEVEKRRKQ